MKMMSLLMLQYCCSTVSKSSRVMDGMVLSTSSSCSRRSCKIGTLRYDNGHVDVDVDVKGLGRDRR